MHFTIFSRLAAAGLAITGLGLANGVHAQPSDTDVYQATAAAVYATDNGYQSIINQRLITAVAQAGNAWIAVGEHGTILRTEHTDTSNGASATLRWQQMPSPSNVLFNDVLFVDDQNGWIVGHEQNILHTQDGGKTWEIQHGSTSPNKALYQLLALDATSLIAVGADGLLLRTTDAGKSWQQQAKLESDDAFFAPDSMPADFGYQLDSITRLNDGSLLTTGEYGILLHSNDNGTTWRSVATPYIASLFGAIPYQQSGVIVFGLRGNVFATESVAAVETLDPEDFDYTDLDLITDSNELAELGWTKLNLPNDKAVFAATRLQDGRYLLMGDQGSAYTLNPESLAITALQLTYLGAISGLTEITLANSNYWLITGQRGIELRPAPLAIPK